MIWGEETVGERIRRLREERGWSQEELADACKLSRDSINRIELGITPVFGEHAEMIGDALNVSTAYLMNGETHAERETRQELEAMVQDGILKDNELAPIYEMGWPRLRASARVPLSRRELLALLEVYRGHRS